MFEVSGHNYIAGTRSAKGTNTLRSHEASTGEALPYRFHQATLDEVDCAAVTAASAYPTFRNLSAARRAEFLDAIASELEALDDDFIALVCRETALPTGRIQGERARTSGQMRLFATMLRRGDFYGARIDRALPDRQPLPRPDLRQYRTGLGPVAVFGASNFPLAFSTAGGDTASAFAAGCPVVFKAHSGHMATADYVADAITRAAQKTGMPDGVFSLLYGSVGEALVKHPSIQAVGFTGSLRGGRALCDMAAARPQPIPVFAEMSSINPVLLMPEALKVRGDKIAAELSASVVLGAGQFCTNPGLVVGIRSPEFSAFLERFVALMGEQPEQTMLNAGALKSYCHGLENLHANPGMTHLAGVTQTGNQARPQVFKADASLLINGDELLQEEVFGPATIIVEVADHAQLLQALHGLRGQLTATLIVEDTELDTMGEVLALLEQKVGRVLFNGYPTGVEVCDAMVHGGPYPATSDARSTSVGTLAIDRFLRPVCYQNCPDSLLPQALRNGNPLGINRLVDGVSSRDAL
jgi:NADP-dependent aldehyde dehydrogenase